MPPRRAETPSVPFTVRLSQAERELAKQAARVNHQSQGEFLRDALVTAASECMEIRRVPRSRSLHIHLITP